ncbi:hypothetical protein [Nocardia sp. CY41]|uniref:hypothetical protein n=1 Tax=Nocardia sp. CY41 TaxID=2608686 RepID=UPI001358EA6E|nr:hypothetical protein [Nocardia sp. CY41]
MTIVAGAVAVVALLALLALIGWACGSLVARVLGALLVLDSLLGLSTVFLNPARLLPSILALAVGVALWLLGHRIYLAKYGRWRSDMAYRAFSAPGLRYLAPARARA